MHNNNDMSLMDFTSDPCCVSFLESTEYKTFYFNALSMLKFAVNMHERDHGHDQMFKHCKAMLSGLKHQPVDEFSVYENCALFYINEGMVDYFSLQNSITVKENSNDILPYPDIGNFDNDKVQFDFHNFDKGGVECLFKYLAYFFKNANLNQSLKTNASIMEYAQKILETIESSSFSTIFDTYKFSEEAKQYHICIQSVSVFLGKGLASTSVVLSEVECEKFGVVLKI